MKKETLDLIEQLEQDYWVNGNDYAEEKGREDLVLTDIEREISADSELLSLIAQMLLDDGRNLPLISKVLETSKILRGREECLNAERKMDGVRQILKENTKRLKFGGTLAVIK